MNQEELNRFLATVRKTRFVDYLDPIGETAVQAFERRVRWAQRSLDDPANVDEANFLLDYEYELRELVKEEMAQEADDDWVVGVEAGDEVGARTWQAKPNTRTDTEDSGFAPDELPPARRLNTAPLPVQRTKTAPEDPIMPAALRRQTTPPPVEEDAADVPFKRAAPARPVAAKPAEKPAAKPVAKPAPQPAAKSAPVVGKGRGKAPMLPEEPGVEDDPWDVEQTGIMRMEDLTPTPLQARANKPKAAPKPVPLPSDAPEPVFAVPATIAPPPKSINTTSGPETVDAASGWEEDDDEDAEEDVTRVDVSSAALRGRGTPAPVQRSPTPRPAPVEQRFGSEPEPEPEPVADPVSASRASNGPALLSRSSLVQHAPEARPARRSRAPLVIGFIGLLAAAGGAIVFLPPMLSQGGGTDAVEPHVDPPAEAVAVSEPPTEPEPELEVLDLTAEPPPEILDLTQDPPASGAVAGVSDPKATTGGTKTTDPKTATTGGTKTTDPKTATTGGTKTTDPKTATTGGTKTTDPKTGTTGGTKTTDPKTATAEPKTGTTGTTEPKTASTGTTGGTTKTDGGTKATTTEAATTTAATSAEAAPVVLKGLWTGKVDGKPLYFTIVRIDGTAVTANAEFQRDEGFQKLDLRGTYDEASGAIDLSDTGGNGTFRGNLKENKFAGTAVVGAEKAQVTWSAAKR